MCTIPIEDLIAHLEGSLDGARAEYVAAHVRACPECRAQIAALQQTDRLLETHRPLIDDPAARRQVLAVIRRNAQRRTARQRSWLSPMTRGHSGWRARVVGAASTLGLVGILMLQPGWADATSTTVTNATADVAHAVTDAVSTVGHDIEEAVNGD